mmetsp:Transcript_28197/g.71908  ORF Transcript_28197/g.71908 Transcript_28197/m.71908 type:complete len:469 (-) Transcript_28197:214-1620(-)
MCRTLLAISLLLSSALAFTIYREQLIDVIAKEQSESLKGGASTYSARTGAQCQLQNFSSNVYGSNNEIVFSASTLHSTRIATRAALICFSSTSSFDLNSTSATISSVKSRTNRFASYQSVSSTYTAQYGHLFEFLYLDNYYAYSFERTRYDDFAFGRYDAPYVVNTPLFTGGNPSATGQEGPLNCMSIEGTFQGQTDYEITLSVSNPSSADGCPTAADMPFQIVLLWLGENSDGTTVVRGDKYGTTCMPRTGVTAALSCTPAPADANAPTVATACNGKTGVVDTKYPSCVQCDTVSSGSCSCAADKLKNLVGPTYCGEEIFPGDSTVVSLADLPARLCSKFSAIRAKWETTSFISDPSLWQLYLPYFVLVGAPSFDYEWAKHANFTLYAGEVQDGRRLSDPSRYFGIGQKCALCSNGLSDHIGDLEFLSIQTFRLMGKIIADLSTPCSQLYTTAKPQLDPSPSGIEWG